MWARECQRSEGRSLRRALARAFGGPFLLAACFKLVYDSLQMVGPYVLKERGPHPCSKPPPTPPLRQGA